MPRNNYVRRLPKEFWISIHIIVYSDSASRPQGTLLIYTRWLPEACQRRSLSGGGREGGRESQLRNACQRRSLSGCQREGGREGGGREGGRDSSGKRVRGGERSERDGHRCKYRQHRRNLNTSPVARGLPQSEGHYRSYSLYSPLSMPLIFWPCLSICFALYYHIAVDQSKLCFFVSSLPAFLN